MAKIRLKHVDTFKDRFGQVRYYFRRGKGARVPLPGAPGSKEFMAAYQLALSGAQAAQPPPGAPGTIHALVTAYLASPVFKGRAEVTQAAYRNILERFRKAHGDKSIIGFQPQHGRALLNALADRPQPAYSLWRVLRGLFKFAAEEKFRPDNPMAVVPAPRRPKTDGYKTAAIDHVETFRAHWPLGSKPRLAFELLFNTAARRQDAVLFGRQHVKDGVLEYRQLKTGVILRIKVTPELQAALDLLPPGQLTFLLTEYGLPFSPAGFTNWFRDKCADAGLPRGISPHSLRKGLLTHLADNGATTRQLMAVSGHTTLSEAERYTRKADQKRLAADALGLLENINSQTGASGLGKRAKR